MKRVAYLYFTTNGNNNVLYIGVTTNLTRRVAEHKAKVLKGFTRKYNCDKLVYYEEYLSIMNAISREKQLKNWKREWKNALVVSANPEWKDFSEEIGVDDEWIEFIKSQYKDQENQTHYDNLREND
jgi:putative endonuclease